MAGRVAIVLSLLLAATITIVAGDTVMTAICNGKMKVYLDGVLQSSTSNSDLCSCWKTPSSFIIPSGTQEVGVECENTEGWGGILASFHNGRGTDRTWQCSDVSFDVGMFPASVIGSNGIHWEEVSTISSSADWIWTPNFKYDTGRTNKAFCKGSVSAPETGTGSCPEDFTYDANTDFCFKAIVNSVTWVQANYLCGQLGRGIRLASPDTLEKMNLVGDSADDGEDYHIGLIEMAEGEWFWTATGEALSQSSWWQPLQPDNFNSESVGNIRILPSSSPRALLNDLKPDHPLRGYVCEWRPN